MAVRTTIERTGEKCENAWGASRLPAASLRGSPTHHGCVRRVIAGAATLVSGYVFRETLIEAEKAAADDPEFRLVQPK